MAKSKKKDKARKAPAPRLLERPSIRSLTAVEQPVCLSGPQPSTEALSSPSVCVCVYKRDSGQEAVARGELMQLDLSRFVPELEDGVGLRQDPDQTLLFHEKTQRTYVINSGAAAIAELIDGERSAKKIAQKLLRKYCVAKEALLADLEAFLKTLASMGLTKTR